MLTVNINKKVKSIEGVYTTYIAILEGITGLRLTKQEKIVILELLKERKLTKKVKEVISEKIPSEGRVENILTTFRKRGILKNNEISPFFKQLDDKNITFNVIVNNEA